MFEPKDLEELKTQISGKSLNVARQRVMDLRQAKRESDADDAALKGVLVSVHPEAAHHFFPKTCRKPLPGM